MLRHSPSSPEPSPLEHRLRDRGRALARGGLSPSTLVFDLDETLWDWASPVLRQPMLVLEHVEYIFVRRPLLWLLQGLAEGQRDALMLWTSGYGYRIDRICEHVPELGRLIGLVPGQESASLSNVFTRPDYLTALQRDPLLVPDPNGRWLAHKFPGMPTVGGKPAVDAARVLVDDKEENCRRFVAAGEGRSAIWLRNTPRVWRNNFTWARLPTPPPLQWAEGVADALEAITGGRVELYPVDPTPSAYPNPSARIRIPHERLWRDWIAPGRAVEAILERRRGGGPRHTVPARS